MKPNLDARCRRDARVAKLIDCCCYNVRMLLRTRLPPEIKLLQSLAPDLCDLVYDQGHIARRRDREQPRLFHVLDSVPHSTRPAGAALCG